jgi:DNA-binding XRE family transcriptional regulator
MKGGDKMQKMTLKAARVNVGLTQKEAALKLGISNKTLWSWEKGLSAPKATQTGSICKLYDVAYDNLIFFRR